jgi:hypothetical protein
MKQFITKTAIFLLTFVFSINSLFAQNAVLINFGSSNCYSSGNPSFSLINNPLGVAPAVLASCGLTAQLPSFFSVFIAYNPRSNKVYVADVRSGVDTKIWVLDIGLPSNIACPVIPVAPTYSYSYVSNNFEFDNNGDLWSFSNYNATTGQCNMDKFDVATGTVINTRILQFPPGNYPTTISSGDLTILPNGRMFATLGDVPSKLYEINNYSGSNATATYLQTLPQNCYGIAYLNGQLELTGIDFNGICYYFDYNISNNTLGLQKPFQIGQGPIDNTSLTPSLGVTKQLVNTVRLNKKTVDLTYEVYVKNIGNVIIKDINVSDDLGLVFGQANISNVTTEFAPGGNSGGLTLNPLYNGTSNIKLLNSGQNLPNQTVGNTNYFFKLIVKCRVTNVNAAVIYNNSAVGSGTIGNQATNSLINVSDSSNNGNETVIDPNNNGNAGEPGENMPTPLVLSTLPVSFTSVSASLINKNTATIKWTIATPVINAQKFQVEYSGNGTNWQTIGAIPITNANQSNYKLIHQQIPTGNLFYRIKELDKDGSYDYSRIVLLQPASSERQFVIIPNPANSFIQVSSPYDINGNTQLELFDVAGRRLLSRSITFSTEEINTSQLANGTYVIKLTHNEDTKTQKVLIVH